MLIKFDIAVCFALSLISLFFWELFTNKVAILLHCNMSQDYHIDTLVQQLVQ